MISPWQIDFAKCCILPTVLFTLFSTTVLFVVYSRASWFWRLLPLVLLICGVAPIGYYPIARVFAEQAIVMIVILRIHQRWRNRRPLGLEPSAQLTTAQLTTAERLPRIWRFSLVDLLKFMLLASIALALSSLWPEHEAFELEVLQGVALWGTGWGLAAVLVVAAVWSSAPWWQRALCVPIAVCLMTAVQHRFLTELIAYPLEAYGPGGLLVWLVAAWELLPLSLILLLGRAALASRRPASLERSVRSRLAAVGAGAVLLVVGAVAVDWYRTMLPPRPPAIRPLANNSHDRLMQLGKSLDWSALPQRDPGSAAENAQFMQANAKAFAEFDTLLDEPYQVPVDWHDHTSGNWIDGVLDWGMALEIKAAAAVQANQHADLIQTNLEMIRLGCQIQRGGLNFHQSIGADWERGGATAIDFNWQSFDREDLSRLSTQVDRLLASREPIEELARRNDLADRIGYGWHSRYQYWLQNRWQVRTLPSVEEDRHQADALLTLLLAQTAVRMHEIDTGELPESISALVPNYLKQVPIDPYSNRPLVYRREGPKGFVLYSVGANATDDGGELVRFVEATAAANAAIGDLFLDAK